MDAGAVLDRMESVEGWFSRREGELLLALAVRALAEQPAAALVEIGSYCGRSTIVLGEAARWLGGRVVAIDPHQGEVSFAEAAPPVALPSLERLERTLADAGLRSLVRLEVRKSFEVAWSGPPIGLLLIDGLHDRENVERDLRHFEPHLSPGAYVAFHDVNPHYAGPREVAALALASGRYQHAAQSESLLALRFGQPAAREAELRAALEEMASSAAVRTARWVKKRNARLHALVGSVGRAALRKLGG